MSHQERQQKPSAVMHVRQYNGGNPGLKVAGQGYQEIDRKELKAADHEPLLRPRSEGTYLFRERPRGSFRQVYTLDDTIDPSKVDAVLEGGILTLTLHRKEAVKPRKIAVRS